MEHHTHNLGTPAAIEIMECVVRHGDFAFCTSTTKEKRRYVVRATSGLLQEKQISSEFIQRS